MRYRTIMQMSLTMIILISGPISAQAVFPETELSGGAKEPRQTRNKMQHTTPDLHDDHRELGNARRDLPRNTQDSLADRQDDNTVPRNLPQPLHRQNESSAKQLQQDQQHLRHDHQAPRQDRQNLRIDRNKQRHDQRELRTDRSKKPPDRRNRRPNRQQEKIKPPHPPERHR